ncbi:hypothetical protein [Oleiharenicola lentus]|uniref:hypothetical protein n=1 Tax=Oleiharenicola lentus TaxID=2508720 RepID=UPI003F671546
MTKFLIILAVLGLLVLCSVAARWHRKLEAALPERHMFNSQSAAFMHAEQYARNTGGKIRPILGTGSMAPYIPAAPAGMDPRKTIVAFAVEKTNVGFGDVRTGSLVIYAADWANGSLTIHQAASSDSEGWIMTGFANPSYENQTRVTLQNFVGLTDRVFTWDQ